MNDNLEKGEKEKKEERYTLSILDYNIGSGVNKWTKKTQNIEFRDRSTYKWYRSLSKSIRYSTISPMKVT